ncbi:MAG: SsrA-binding protein SmpB [Melioribacteraceae bacterium]|nr:SsrA-binding protein SmpB [Melioribacteraceae bacterium]
MSEKIVEKNITVNRKARHDYFVIQSYEAGIVLLGTEVKALRQNKANLSDAYASIKNNEVWLNSAHIGVYDFGNINNHDPLRIRKLLLNKREIKKLSSKINEKGHTLVPLRLYFLNGKVKVELGLCKGKKSYDKRDDIKERDVKRDLDRYLKN